jgi:hypothetical protein
MPIERKSAKALNVLRQDVQDILNSMSNTVEGLQESIFHLSNITPHDCFTDDGTVSELYREADKALRRARSQMTAFKAARDRYVNFF